MMQTTNLRWAYVILPGLLAYDEAFDIAHNELRCLHVAATACQGRRFLLSGNHKTWGDARRRCSDNEIKGMLVSVKDMETQNRLVDKAQQEYDTESIYAWLGGRRTNNNDNTFQWRDRTVFTRRTSSAVDWTNVGYTAWMDGSVGSGLCVVLAKESGRWGWITNICGNENFFICEREEPRIISFSQSSYIAKIGDSITISGTISEHFMEPLTVTAIYSNNRRVQLQTNYKGTTFSYTITSVTLSHFGDIKIEIVGKTSFCLTVAAVTLMEASLTLSLDQSEIVATYGAQNVITCTGSGYLNVLVQWKRNTASVALASTDNIYQTISQPSTYTGRSVLRITVGVIAESGNYVCEATNWDGGGVRTRTLNVKVPANISTTHSSIIGNYFEQTSVDCVSYGFPRPSATWKKNRMTVSTNSNLPVYFVIVRNRGFEYRVRLYLNISDVSQSGEYQCIASNSVGEEQTQVFTLYVPANISVTQSSITVEQYLATTVYCTSYGNPFPVTRWYRLGKNLKVSTKTTIIRQAVISQGTYFRTLELNLNNTDVTDGGVYECQVLTNLAGPKKVKEIYVKVAPNITLTQAKLVANFTQHYQVDCISFGFPRPTVTWLRNKHQITGSTTASSIYEALHTTGNYSQTVRLYFTINSIVESGVYVCQTTIDAGGTFRKMTLQVQVPANISISSTSKAATIPDEFVIDCESYGFPRPKLEWTRNGSPISLTPIDPIYQHKTNISEYKSISKLFFNISSIDQIGKYKCQATNVDTNVKPNTYLSATELTVLEDKTSSINCSYLGYPALRVNWTRGSYNVSTNTSNTVYQRLVEVTDFQITSSLTFYRPTIEDSGEYTCNTVGTGSTANANVKVGPYVATVGTSPIFSQSQTFTCTFTGDPIPTVYWRINGRQIENTSNTPTQITNMKEGNQVQSKLLISSSVIFGPNSSVGCWSENFALSKQRTIKMNADLRFANGTYFTEPNATLDFHSAKKYCGSVGGVLPTLSILNSSFYLNKVGVDISWLQGKISTNGGDDCIAYNTVTQSVYTQECTMKKTFICVFSAIEVLGTSNCYPDRITVEWKDMTDNNGSITHIVTALNSNHSVNVSKLTSQTATSNHIYTSTVGNLTSDVSYDVSIQLFPEVWKINSPATSAVTSSIFRDVSAQMSLKAQVCEFAIIIPENITSVISEIKLRYLKTQIGSTADQNNWTEVTLSPNASKHSEMIGLNQQLFATFQPITTHCRNTVFKVGGECRASLNSETPDALPLAAIAAPSSIFLLLVIVFILCGVYREQVRRWISHRKSPGAARGDTVMRRKSSQHMPLSNTDVLVESAESNTKILRFYLVDFYIDSSKSDHKTLKSQFKTIKDESINNASVYENTTASTNAKKNRYKNITPYDNNRVILRGAQGNQNHYINASYVEGYNRPNKWIATQGPLDSTVGDFWTMVLEQNVRVIVMLANLWEKGKSKCARYWPEDVHETKSYEGVNITVIDVIKKGSYVIRRMNVEETNSTYEIEQYIVTQYHFIAWPDHGVPQTTTGLVRFMKEVQETQTQLQCDLRTETPTIVHCSAGAGRTGTFIGFDYLTDELNESGSIDVFKAVSHMRNQRMDMVQNVNQYVFLHKLLVETATFKETNLTQLERFPDANQIQKEFNDLSILFDESASSLVTFQNSTSVSYKSPEAESAYMNVGNDRKSVYKIEAYNQSDRIMISEEPTAGEVENFLSTLVHENTEFVVILKNPMKVLVWPNQKKREIVQGGIKMKFVKGSTQGQFQLAKISIDDTNQQRKTYITLLEFDAWTDNDIPDNINHFIEFLSLLKSLQMNSLVYSMAVLSRTGYSRSIVFCAVWNLIARYNAEKMVDVFRTVKNITDSFSDIHLTVEQYKACYTLAKACIEFYKE
uniref:Tyrosine-protein phosphatase non-receptor type 20 n=1 Tax=Phallusia mammillata TaxID=59560 RepID=A0A6F9DQW1_9ASCI|nr:receptor-type tyrosine-protein phosphatase epsilon [Phallusia mammillata]